MSVFAVTYLYGPDTQTRMDNRPAHRAWQSNLVERGVILSSGPLDDEPQPGGLLILSAADRAEVESHLAEDPYASIGVIEEVSIRGWTPVFGPFAEA
ncbi:MAG: YciI family protein [Brevibacterium sp.]